LYLSTIVGEIKIFISKTIETIQSWRVVGFLY